MSTRLPTGLRLWGQVAVTLVVTAVLLILGSVFLDDGRILWIVGAPAAAISAAIVFRIVHRELFGARQGGGSSRSSSSEED